MTCPFEPSKPRTKHKVEIKKAEQFETLHKMEQSFYREMVKRCKDTGANLVICQWGFDDEANYLLKQYGLSAIRWVGGVEIELISTATGASIVPRFQELTSSKLGSADMVREVSFGTTNDKAIFIEGCPYSHA